MPELISADVEGDAAAMRIDISLVRELAEMLDETRLTEIEVQDGERRIRVARAVTVAAVPAEAAPAPVTAPAAVSAPAAPAGPDLANAVRSPMVGTAYLSPEPGAATFVAVGDHVAAGQTIVIIEAMKVMNPIAAPRAGKVSAVLIDDGRPVEFDQPLIVID